VKVQQRKTDEIKPYERNPRRNDEAVDAVAESIRRFGFRQPIVVDEAGVIVVGHTRWKAAKKLKLAKVPVHVATGLTAAELKAYRLADNRSAEAASWDLELLPLELSDLKASDFDMGVLGFDEDELARLLGEEPAGGLTDPDDVPDPPDVAKTTPGDLWVLGDHRLLCGDSGKAADVDRLLDGAPIHLVNTDPPYGVKVEPRSNNAIAAGMSSFGASKEGVKALDAKGMHHSGFDVARRKAKRTHHQKLDLARHPGKAKATHKKMRAKDRPLLNDFLSDKDFDELLNLWFENIARVLLPGRAAYIWGGYANCANYPPALKRHGLYFSQAIIWHKMHPVLTRKDFMGDHEWCFYCWREGGAHKFYGPNNATDVWQVKKVNPQSMVHLTEKPVELAVRAIQYSTRRGETVLDLFGGSGSTLIAAEQTGRRSFLLELDPPYCDVIVQRWEAFTGRRAVCEKVAGRNRPSKPRKRPRSAAKGSKQGKRRKQTQRKRA